MLQDTCQLIAHFISGIGSELRYAAYWYPSTVRGSEFTVTYYIYKDIIFSGKNKNRKQHHPVTGLMPQAILVLPSFTSAEPSAVEIDPEIVCK